MRTVKIDYSSGSPKVSYDGSAIGIQGEHRASELVIVPPPDMPSGLEYRLAFDPGGMSDTLSLTDGELRYELPQSITRHEVVSMNIEGYEGAARIYKSVMVELYFDEAVDTDNPVDADGHSIGAEVAENTAARHTHDNKDILDKFGETNGKLQYDGSDVGLKGEKGDKGDTGATGAQGEPGKDGADGKDGAPGADGTSATHSWNGTVLTITSASGTSSADLKGEKGDKGDKGEKGDKGDKGDTGADGYTPVKGTDYWTAADKQEIVADTLAALPTWTGGSY